MMRTFARALRPAVAFLALVAAFAPGAAAEAEEPLAMITYADGPFTLTRDGAAVKARDIGDPVYDDDYLRTGPGATVTLELSSRTGMRGTITMSQNSSFYLRQDIAAGERQNQAEMIAGSLAVKVKKLAGSPGFTVTTETSTCGVRGTEFEVTTSYAGDVIVSCSEGEVACSSDGDTSSAVPGQVVERRAGGRFERHAMAVEAYRGYRDAWARDRDAEFRRDAQKNALELIGRYLELQARLDAASRRLAADADLKAWAAERKAGKAITSGLDELQKDVSRVGKRLEAERDLLGSMERMSAKIEALREALGKAPDSFLAKRLEKNGTIREFFARFDAARAKDDERMAALRGGFKLLRQRQNALEEGRGPQSGPAGQVPPQAMPRDAGASGAAGPGVPAPGGEAAASPPAADAAPSPRP